MGDQAWRFSSAVGDREECELCQSKTTTDLQYGIRVCPSCDRKFLP